MECFPHVFSSGLGRHDVDDKTTGGKEDRTLYLIVPPALVSTIMDKEWVNGESGGSTPGDKYKG